MTQTLKELALAAKGLPTDSWLPSMGEFRKAADPDAILALLDLADDRLAQLTDDQKRYLDLRDDNKALREALEDLVSEFGICGLTDNAIAVLQKGEKK